ncbi:MAG: polysaccharide biosynthesis protein [Eubacteriaceae bacterium]|nr:polysaccharide biosynthesis protein [Eubacteriaceae bacterium]
MSKHSFIRGAAILGIAGVLVKVLGAIYQIPFARMIGATGMACYTPAYNVYTIFIVIATSGIPVAISRMVSERIIVQNYEGAHRVFHISFKLMLGIGAAAFLIMFFGADVIANISAVPESALAMKTIAPALIIVPVMAAFRGYYQGQQNMKPTALSQVIEQVFRVIIGLTAAYLLYNSIIGIFSSYDAGEKGAAGGAFGATIGSLGGLVVMLLVYALSRRSIKARVAKSKNIEPETNGEILKKILWFAVPITLGACIAPIMSYLDSPLVINRLVSIGYAKDVAQNLYGQIGGYVMPLVNLPQALSMALSMSLVPMISSAHRTKSYESLQENTSLAVRLAVMIGMPCAAGMAVLAEPILLLLYSSHAEEAINVAPTFAIMALSIVFISIVQTVSGVLQGVGKQFIPVRNMIIGIVIKIAATWILVGIKGMDIKGAALATLITYIVVASLDLRATRKHTGALFKILLTYIRPAVSTLVMAAVAWLMYYVVFGGRQGDSIACLIAILAAAVVYTVMLFVTKSIRRKDLESFAAGQKLLRAIDRLGLKI